MARPSYCTRPHGFTFFFRRKGFAASNIRAMTVVTGRGQVGAGAVSLPLASTTTAQRRASLALAPSHVLPHALLPRLATC